MGSFTGTPFTVDLSGACGHGCPDCDGCCGVNACGCSGLPTTLHISTTLVGPGPCHDSFAITWDATNTWWAGSGSMHCGVGCITAQTVEWRLFCSMGTWQLHRSCDNFTTFENVLVSSPVCSPFSLTISGTMDAACSSCGNFNYSGTVTA
jgi:hypothetical protein